MTTPVLTAGSLQTFTLASEEVQLALMELRSFGDVTASWESDTLQTASFTYDDTAFRAVPAGVLRTLAACAGQVAQLGIQPVYAFKPAIFGIPPGTPTGAPTLDSLTVSMAGFGDLELADNDASNTAGSLVTLADELPIGPNPPPVLLLRPTPIPGVLPIPGALWDSRRTLWLPGEIGQVTYTFEVTACDVVLYFYWQAQGYNHP